MRSNNNGNQKEAYVGRCYNLSLSSSKFEQDSVGVKVENTRSFLFARCVYKMWESDCEGA